MISIVSVHYREEGCIGKYIPRGPRDFPRAGILHPGAREISRGRSPREISRAEGCKIHARGKSRGPRGMYFPMHPSSRQCTSILSSLVHIERYSICIFYIKTIFIRCCILCLGIYFPFIAIALTFCLPAIYHQWATLHHCWSIVNVSRARMCSRYSP